MRQLTEQEVRHGFQTGHNCAQQVAAYWAEELGYDQEELERAMACFGGGMSQGDACGALTGAYLVLGLASADGAQAAQRGEELRRRFQTACGSLCCRDILGYDFSQPGQKEACRAAGRIGEVCPGCVLAALNALEEILA